MRTLARLVCAQHGSAVNGVQVPCWEARNETMVELLPEAKCGAVTARHGPGRQGVWGSGLALSGQARGSDSTNLVGESSTGMISKSMRSFQLTIHSSKRAMSSVSMSWKQLERSADNHESI